MSTTTNTQAVPDDLDLMHADQITRIWRECQSQGLDHVAFAWRIEREGWRRLLTALTSAPPAPSVGGWMPIESAPKDGRKFLAWRRHSTLPLIVFYNADYDQYECSEGHLVFSLTHWQPLPQPPKEKP